MAHRNRWFTWVYLLKMVDLSMAMLNNHMVIGIQPLIIIDICRFAHVEVDMFIDNHVDTYVVLIIIDI
jgi:hypothetical protein